MKRLLNFLIFNFMFYVDGDGAGGGGGAFMGGEGGGGTAEGGTTPPQNAPDSDGIQYKYPEGLDPSYHGNKTLLKYADKEGNFKNAEVFKALIHAASQMGADKMVVPNKNFTDDQWADTYRKLGNPEKLEDYAINNNIPDGMTGNEELFKNFTAKAHELGVHPKQAQGLMDFYNTSMGEQNALSSTATNERLEQETAALKTEWGNGYDKEMNVAEQALLHFFPNEDSRKAIVETGFLDTIAGTKFFNMLGNGLAEDTFTPDQTAGFGANNGDLDASIAQTHGELFSMGKQHPQYAAKLNQYNSLLVKRHGTGKVADSVNSRV